MSPVRRQPGSKGGTALPRGRLWIGYFIGSLHMFGFSKVPEIHINHINPYLKNILNLPSFISKFHRKSSLMKSSFAKPCQFSILLRWQGAHFKEGRCAKICWLGKSSILDWECSYWATSMYGNLQMFFKKFPPKFFNSLQGAFSLDSFERLETGQRLKVSRAGRENMISTPYKFPRCFSILPINYYIDLLCSRAQNLLKCLQTLKWAEKPSQVQ